MSGRRIRSKLSLWAKAAPAILLLTTFPVSVPATTVDFAAEPLPFISMWGNVGSGDGQIQDAIKISVTADGDVYVAELGNNRIQQFTSTGAFVRTWAVPDSWGVAVSPSGFVYVGTRYAIHKYTATGIYQGGWGSLGSGPGQFHFIQDVAVDADENVYAADLANHRIQKFTADGAFVRAWPLQGAGSGYPKGITAGPDGYVYVSDSGNSTIQKFSRDGDFITSWMLPDGTPGEGNRLGRPAVGPQGEIYVPDTFGHRIVVLSGDFGWLTSWGSFGAGPGQFQTPTCAALDGHGTLYVMDYWNYRVQKFGLTPTSVPQAAAVPREIVLHQPRPNPMRKAMRVRFSLTGSGPAGVSIFDVRGRLVNRIWSGVQADGLRDIAWDGRDSEGGIAPTGVYWVRLTAGHSVTRRLVLLR